MKGDNTEAGGLYVSTFQRLAFVEYDFRVEGEGSVILTRPRARTPAMNMS